MSATFERYSALSRSRALTEDEIVHANAVAQQCQRILSHMFNVAEAKYTPFFVIDRSWMFAFSVCETRADVFDLMDDYADYSLTFPGDAHWRDFLPPSVTQREQLFQQLDFVLTAYRHRREEKAELENLRARLVTLRRGLLDVLTADDEMVHPPKRARRASAASSAGEPVAPRGGDSPRTSPDLLSYSQESHSSEEYDPTADPDVEEPSSSSAAAAAAPADPESEVDRIPETPLAPADDSDL